MKFGLRTPSLKRMVRARTTGRVMRVMKNAVNPLYGTKGMGLAREPKKALYDRLYRRTSFSLKGLFRIIH